MTQLVPLDEPRDAAPLPRLLYVGDVPVESSYHGSALLYRLFEGYPADRLRVIEAGLVESQPARRLPDVPYVFAPAGTRRLSDTRLHAWYQLWLSLCSGARATSLCSGLAGFQPDAVVTVAHGLSWVSAEAIASRLNLPLHLIVHDDWPRLARLPRPFGKRVEHQFARVYRGAASRLCVSPFMTEEYCRRYGRSGTVLYPSRGSDARVYAAPPTRPARVTEALTYAFAGTINTPDYIRLIRMLAKHLTSSGGRVLIFGPITSDQARDSGLAGANIELRGLIPSDALVDVLRSEVDVLFVPMSFAERDRPNMEISFPSKLTDYTAVGLPILIAGPSYCSAVRWAREYVGVAEIADQDKDESVRDAVQRLQRPEVRSALAARALDVGARMFSSEHARRQLQTALLTYSSATQRARGEAVPA